MVDLLSLSPEAQALLIGITDTTSSLEPGTRQRLVSAADRGMAARREDASPLPRLLFVIRNRDNRPMETVAASVGAEDQMLLEIERGERDIRDLSPSAVASWIQLFGVSADVAIEALRATFHLRADPDRASASAPADMAKEQYKFIDEVSEILKQA